MMSDKTGQWVVILKSLVFSAREQVEDQRFGQYLYNSIRSHPSFPDTGGDARLEEQYVGERLWNMEAKELAESIDAFEEPIKKSA